MTKSDPAAPSIHRYTSAQLAAVARAAFGVAPEVVTAALAAAGPRPAGYSYPETTAALAAWRTKEIHR